MSFSARSSTNPDDVVAHLAVREDLVRHESPQLARPDNHDSA